MERVSIDVASLRLRTPLVSVIVRLRNDADTVQRAIESIISQDIDSFEIIAVDCESTDRSREIIDSFAERDVRVDALHSDSPSFSAGANLALAHARGTYVTFVDGSSWLAPHALEELLDFAQDNRLDIALGGLSVDMRKHDGSVSSQEIVAPTQVFVSQHEYRSNAWRLLGMGQMGIVPGKLLLRERIERLGLRFDDSTCGELGFMAGYCRDAERVGVLGMVSVHVPQVTGQELSQGEYATLPARCDRHFELMLELYHYWGLDGDPASMDVVRNRHLERVVSYIGMVCGPDCTLPAEEKHRIVVELIGSKHVQLAASATKPRSMVVSALSIPIKAQNVKLAMGGAAFMSRVFGKSVGLPLSLDIRS